jgi:PTH1 family peptidyl-tRNA hydrolase
MKLIIGLGNPGKKYQNNRHNAGQLFIDYLKEQKLKGVSLNKSSTFMNNSGEFVAQKVGRNFDLNNLFIVHDDLDIALGDYKIQKGKGPKDHKGLISIDEALGESDYWYVRVGVDSRDLGQRTPGEVYVLEDFTESEKEILQGVFGEIYLDFKNNYLNV